MNASNPFAAPLHFCLERLKLTAEGFAAQAAGASHENRPSLWEYRLGQFLKATNGPYDSNSRSGYLPIVPFLAEKLKIPAAELYPTRFAHDPKGYAGYWAELRPRLTGETAAKERAAKEAAKPKLSAEDVARYMAIREVAVAKNVHLKPRQTRKLKAAERHKMPVKGPFKPRRGHHYAHPPGGEEVFPTCGFRSLLLHIETVDADKKRALLTIVDLEAQAAKKKINLSREDFDHFLYDQNIYFSDVLSGVPKENFYLLAKFLDKKPAALLKEYYSGCLFDSFITTLAEPGSKKKPWTSARLLEEAKTHGFNITPIALLKILEGDMDGFREGEQPKINTVLAFVSQLTGKTIREIVAEEARAVEEKRRPVRRNQRRWQRGVSTASVSRISDNRRDDSFEVVRDIHERAGLTPKGWEFD